MAFAQSVMIVLERIYSIDDDRSDCQTLAQNESIDLICESAARQHLFLLCGLPFSGKSTVGRALQEQLGIVHVEVDRFHAKRDGEFVERRVERTEWITAYRLAYGEVEAALLNRMSVVFDAVSYRRTQRDRIRRLATNLNVPMSIIWMETTPEQARERMAQNLFAPIRPIVPEADFNEVLHGMQPPMDDEPLIRYNPGEAIDSWIQRVVAPLITNQDAS